VDPIVEKIDDKLDDDKPLTQADLQAMREELEAHINSLRTDKVKDAEEKAQDRARMEALDDRLKKLLEAQEEKDRTTSDSTTIIVPPGNLNPPTHQNSNATTDTTHENQSEQQVAHRKRGWKRLY
jgi:RPA family protein